MKERRKRNKNTEARRKKDRGKTEGRKAGGGRLSISITPGLARRDLRRTPPDVRPACRRGSLRPDAGGRPHLVSARGDIAKLACDPSGLHRGLRTAREGGC